MPSTSTDANLSPLLTRRSVAVKDLHAPAPSDAQLESILRVATRVPDHGKLCPWRIVILRGQGALNLGEIAARQFAKQTPDATQAHITAERTRFTRAPLCLAVISTPIADSKPIWEQQLSAAAVCMNILHATHALGFGGKWLTEWVAYDATILAALLQRTPSPPPVAPARIAGFLYIGSKASEPDDRERPNLADVVGEWK